MPRCLLLLFLTATSAYSYTVEGHHSKLLSLPMPDDRLFTETGPHDQDVPSFRDYVGAWSAQFAPPSHLLREFGEDTTNDLPSRLQLAMSNTEDGRDDDDGATLEQAFQAASTREDSHETKKRQGPSLSIVNPLDVLRQRLLLEMARRRMKENQEQIQANAELLKNLGKRSDSSRHQRRRHTRDYTDVSQEAEESPRPSSFRLSNA